MKIKFIFILLIMLIPCFSQAQPKRVNREVLLLQLNDRQGEIKNYGCIIKGRRVRCRIKDPNDTLKYIKINGRLTHIDSNFLVLDTTRIYFNQIHMLSTWTISKSILKASGGPVILSGLVLGTAISVYVSPAGFLLLPASLAAGITFLCLSAHKYYLKPWSCSKSTYGDFLQNKLELKLMLHERAAERNHFQPGGFPHGFPTGRPGMRK